jgi:hypothetical protein
VKTSSCKAKGRELCKTVQQGLFKRFPDLHIDDIRVTSSGTNGEDLQFSPAARAKAPISIECKNRAAFAIYKDYAQATTNANKYNPVLVIKQNRSKPLAVIDLEYFLDLLKERV